MINKSVLRQQMRELRKQLSADHQQHAATRLANRVHKHPIYLGAQHIAGYIAVAGEIDPMPLLRHANRVGKHVYLPVLRGDHMVFVRCQPGITRLTPNRFGIPEPRWRKEHVLSPAHLDLVLMPLLAFDAQRQRLGMGGGFYDRTFAFKSKRHANAKPLLLGIAHAFQQVEKVPTDHWDVALKGVATDCGILLQGRSISTQRRSRRLSENCDRSEGVTD
jgi:5-formyltetrahydrofolate cyclo-ligase